MSLASLASPLLPNHEHISSAKAMWLFSFSCVRSCARAQDACLAKSLSDSATDIILTSISLALPDQVPGSFPVLICTTRCRCGCLGDWHRHSSIEDGPPGSVAFDKSLDEGVYLKILRTRFQVSRWVGLGVLILAIMSVMVIIAWEFFSRHLPKEIC